MVPLRRVRSLTRGRHGQWSRSQQECGDATTTQRIGRAAPSDLEVRSVGDARPMRAIRPARPQSPRPNERGASTPGHPREPNEPARAELCSSAPNPSSEPPRRRGRAHPAVPAHPGATRRCHDQASGRDPSAAAGAPPRRRSPWIERPTPRLHGRAAASHTANPLGIGADARARAAASPDRSCEQPGVRVHGGSWRDCIERSGRGKSHIEMRGPRSRCAPRVPQAMAAHPSIRVLIRPDALNPLWLAAHDVG